MKMRGGVPRRQQKKLKTNAPIETQAVMTQSWQLNTVVADGGVALEYRHPKDAVIATASLYVDTIQIPEGAKVYLQAWHSHRTVQTMAACVEITKGENILIKGAPICAWDKVRLHLCTLDASGRTATEGAVLTDVHVYAEFTT